MTDKSLCVSELVSPLMQDSQGGSDIVSSHLSPGYAHCLPPCCRPGPWAEASLMTSTKTSCGRINPDAVNPAMYNLFKTGLDKHSHLNALNSLLELAFPKPPPGNSFSVLASEKGCSPLRVLCERE